MGLVVCFVWFRVGSGVFFWGGGRGGATTTSSIHLITQNNPLDNHQPPKTTTGQPRALLPAHAHPAGRGGLVQRLHQPPAPARRVLSGMGRIARSVPACVSPLVGCRWEGRAGGGGSSSGVGGGWGAIYHHDINIMCSCVHIHPPTAPSSEREEGIGWGAVVSLRGNRELGRQGRTVSTKSKTTQAKPRHAQQPLASFWRQAGWGLKGRDMRGPASGPRIWVSNQPPIHPPNPVKQWCDDDDGEARQDEQDRERKARKIDDGKTATNTSPWHPFAFLPFVAPFLSCCKQTTHTTTTPAAQETPQTTPKKRKMNHAAPSLSSLLLHRYRRAHGRVLDCRGGVHLAKDALELGHRPALLDHALRVRSA